jgi:tRNA (adenine57-N1/adenine58-N1)-methyltransferase catalytic subunit
MNQIPDPTQTQPGDLAQLVSPSNKTFTVRLVPGGQLQTHRGVLEFDDLIGLPWGSEIYSHKGSPFFLLQPALGDLLREMKRATQIMYPKDIGYVLVAMGIGPGTTVLEAGTGSGALTTALAWAVGPQGHVTSYEIRPDTQRLAQKNLERLGLDDRVTFKLRDISEGFDETGVDALFLDVQNSYDYIRQARDALKSGGFFGSILPTTNQVSRLLVALYQYDFAFVDVCEIILRYYKPVPERLRPTDRMVAHTGFLIFGRPMLPSKNRSAIQEVSSFTGSGPQDETGLQEGPESEIFE